MTGPISRASARRWPILVGLALLTLSLFVVPVAAKSDRTADVVAAINATARFHQMSAAQAAGYTVRVTDTAGLTCIADPGGAGAMGVHYLKPGQIPELFDPSAAASVDASTPELLVFAPGKNGTQRLVALEYLTIKATWDAQHSGPPSLFDHPFNQTPAGNRFGLPAYYSLHAWVWDPNPTNLFAPWNPRVTCP